MVSFQVGFWYSDKMGSSQQHGFIVEDLLKKEFDPYAGQAQGKQAPPINSRYTARFDVPGNRDPYGQGLPTSIKTARFTGPNSLVCLSDAVRIAGLMEVPKMRLLVALYQQEGQNKVFSEVREYLIEANEWKTLMGSVPVDLIDDFHVALRAGDPSRARQVARQWKKRLSDEFPSSMRWNPKIDSKTQRRLQCSVRLCDIEAAITDKARICVFGKPITLPQSVVRPIYLKPKFSRLYRRDADALRLPFEIHSPPRVRRPRVLVVGHCVDVSDRPLLLPVAAPKNSRRSP